MHIFTLDAHVRVRSPSATEITSTRKRVACGTFPERKARTDAVARGAFPNGKRGPTRRRYRTRGLGTAAGQRFEEDPNLADERSAETVRHARITVTELEDDPFRGQLIYLDAGPARHALFVCAGHWD